MSTDPYDYENRNEVVPISWSTFHGLCKGLARAASSFEPEIILPVGRGGFYPGTLIAHILQVEVYPIRLSRRVADVIVYRRPRWLVEPPPIVEGRRILVIDEISSTGETLSMVKERIEFMGARAVRSAVLYAHTRGAEAPDYIGLISDALILNPWDREIYQDGRFQLHPEYVEALAQQGIQGETSYQVDAPVKGIAKG